MAMFIKICPKCGHHNPEYENACLVCTYFIGMETPVPAPPADTGGAQTATAQTHTGAAGPGRQTVATAAVATPAQAQPTLYLQVLGTEQVFEVRDGWTVGQSHASSSADLQLRDLPGITFVHRNHCSFSFVDGTWQVTPTDQAQFGRDFTNPTAVNQARVRPGEAHALKNGDQLSLGTLNVVVRIL